MREWAEWLIILLILLFVLHDQVYKEDEWHAYVYRNATDLTGARKVGVYDSIEMCRKAAKEHLRVDSSLNKGDYRCGLNCRYTKPAVSPGMTRCSRMVR